MAGDAHGEMTIGSHREFFQHRIRMRILIYVLFAITLLLGGFLLRTGTWRGNAELHTVLESVATVLALFTGAMALLRYYAKRNSLFLFVGSGFLGAAVLDAYHAAITSSFLAARTPSALSALTPWSGTTSRVLLSVVMCASLFVWTREARQATPRIKESVVYALVGAWTLITFLLFAFLPLPPAYYPDFIIHRPAELAPALLFALAAAGYLWKGFWKSDDFEHWLVLSLIVGAESRSFYMAFSQALFDAPYMADHLLKILGYLFVLTGLSISMFSVFKSEAKNATRLERANNSLANEITVRSKSAEEALSRERSLMRALIDLLPDCLYVKDTESRFLLANRGLAKLIGFDDPELLLGKTDVDFFPRDQAARFRSDEEQLLQSGQPLTYHEEPVCDSSGHTRWLLTTKAPLRNELGEVMGLVGIGRDITDRKAAQEELRQATTAAEAASRAKSQFLANMSHEIRTPLNGIMGMTDLALETELTHEQREYLETVKLSGDSLLSVINDILDFSKIEAGKIDLESIDFDLRDCLEATLKTLAVRGDEKGLELLCEIAPDVPEVVRGDSSRLRQVIVNLVGNAIKFTDEGEVALKVSTQAGNGELCTLHFTVSDTGVGIPAEKQKTIFDPFTQADASTTRKYGGTGLGLTISTRLVAMMGGNIWVQSEIGRGTQFHFTVQLGTSVTRVVEVGTIAPRRYCVASGF